MLIGTKRFSHKKAQSHKRRFSAEGRASALACRKLEMKNECEANEEMLVSNAALR